VTTDERLAGRRALLERAGLHVVRDAAELDVPDPMEAWAQVVGGRVVPATTIAAASVSSLEDVNRAWAELARAAQVIGESGEFFIAVAGVGSATLPWAHVRTDGEARMAQVLGLVPGEPEFVAMATTGTTICAVTTEEDEYWIIVSELRPR
jgi:hypothetical protein